MSKHNTQIYLLRTLTNLHAGAGDANFGIIDKHVQRDSLTDLPAIFASSIKGSLRELLTAGGTQQGIVNDIFGSSNQRGTQAGQDLQQGEYIFYAAKLLALPIRSNHELYYLATTAPLLREFIEDGKRFGLPGDITVALESLARQGADVKAGEPVYCGVDAGKIRLEDMNAKPSSASVDQLEKLLGKRVALLHVNDFHHLAEELPSVARNSLDNGKSVNLWYEEIVPRETRFYCPIAAPKPDDDRLETALAEHDHLVQIGGNATVGNGLCKWSKIS